MPDDELAAAKRAVRAAIRSARAARTAEQRGADDRARGLALVHLLKTLRPTRVAAYLSSGTEPDTGQIVAKLMAQGVEVLLPTSRAGAWSDPAWAPYRGPGALRAGPRDIPEPIGDPLPADAVAGADLVLCPGLAGTRQGDRLGRGGGWYDRVLPLATGPRVLLLNDDEVLDALPVGDLDQRIDTIVTPRGRLDCS